MRELPMLLNGHGVRATLAGTKVQTRRPVKPQPRCVLGGQRYKLNIGDIAMWHGWPHRTEVGGAVPIRNPHGAPGDLLYVRETTRRWGEGYGQYCADMTPVIGDRKHMCYGRAAWWYSRETCPSIHMPKWAARLWVRNTGVRVERVRDISYDDAVAEGIDHEYPKAWVQFRELWDSICAKRGLGWDVNPFVFVTEYEVIER